MLVAGQGARQAVAGRSHPDPAAAHAAPYPATTCRPDDSRTVGPATDTTGRARHASGKNNPTVSKEAPMSQLTCAAPDSLDRRGRLRIRDWLHRAVQEMDSAPLSSELRIDAFSRFFYFSGGPVPF